ncbi:MAG: hypothetical protein IAG10_30395 [Planctomycetaceae bacterium]|nr:hypothetical protein [Planctomycetaceae bacterium]
MTVVLLLIAVPNASAQTLLPDFEKAAQFDEQVRWTRLKSGVRVFVNAPVNWKTSRRVLVIYATPNGSTIEQTLGCAASKERDWRFDIQHVAAQTRRLREIATGQDIVLAVVQAPQLSWPTFQRDQSGAGTVIRELIESLTKEFAADSVELSCHSGGGSFLFGYLNAVESVPASLERIVFLDANYSYSDEDRHGDKLLAWLHDDAVRRLVVVAYDDREITLNGKKVVGSDGGTFRASQRMLTRFRRNFELTERDAGSFQQTSGLDGRMQFFVHPNPDNKILHTALVGEMNGLLHGLTLSTDLETKWGTFGGPRAYTKWIQPQPFVDPAAVRVTIPADAPEVRVAFPERPADAPTGSRFQQQIAELPRDQREAAILRELISGNVPEFLRRLKPIRVQATDDAGAKRVATYFVMADYLAVGTDDDFFRVPITPATATSIADKFDASLITAKVSDDVFAAAQLKRDPKPLTKDRDAAATFWQHHQIIEEQLRGKPRGLLVAGIKKDVVLTNRLKEKPHKVAIYGWHASDGRPIQSVYVGHVDWYVDYSHGVRLMSQQIIVDGRSLKVSEVLKDSRLCPLLSSEGPIDAAEIVRAASWGR